MAAVCVDSNVLIAFASRRDANHEQAANILNGIDDGELPSARLTNYVIAETLGYIHARHRHTTAVDLYSRLKTGTAFELVHQPKVDFAGAEQLFHDRTQLSFVDAALVAYMQRVGLDYLYSFDDDFDAVQDLHRLDTAVNPYQ